MAFITNTSAFGMKPATTGATTQPNTATNTPQGPNTAGGGGLFGGLGQQQNQGGAFGGFGANTQQQNQTQPSGSLFGNLGQNQQNQQQPQQQPGTGLFGQPAGGTQGGTTGGLFGSTQTNTQPGQAGSGLFGSTAQPAQSGGAWNTSNPLLPKTAFGGANQNQGQTQGTSLFGQPQQNTGTSLFGQSQQPQQQQQQQSTGLFGSTTGTSSLFGQQKPQSTFGLSTAPQTQANQPAQGQPLFTKSTKFNDLPDNLKKTFEDIEAHIQGRVQIINDLKERHIGEEATKGQEQIRAVHKDLISCVTVLQSDVFATRELKGKVDQTVQDTIVATHVIDGFRNSQQHGAYLKHHANFPLEFFARITDQIRRRLQWYKETIEQIERKLASTAQQAQYTPQAITTTLEAQHASFIALANKTAALDAELQKLKALYTQLWRQKTGSMRDPFNELDRGSGGEFGLEGLYAK
ncbi:hypothetical protein DENSPDRAFT_844376 [Dentipellis sp. KUC8613]|nr:hypothetical protein DENSPDRAFT_844376 [Dentipellis sp. KUC8613]